MERLALLAPKCNELGFVTYDAYYCFDPASQTLWRWRMVGGNYVPIPAYQEGALWSEQMELWLGRWQGEYLRTETTWLRFWTPDGDLVLTLAEAEARRADAAEAEVARLASLNAVNGSDQGEEKGRCVPLISDQQTGRVVPLA